MSGFKAEKGSMEWKMISLYDETRSNEAAAI